MGNKYLLLSLPASISRSHDREEAFAAIKSIIPSDAGSPALFPIPDLKIGTLDALVLQADELAKLDANVEGAVAKVADVLRNLVPGQEDNYKRVNEQPVEKYLAKFSWNKVKYRSDKSIAEILKSIQREVVSLDSDIKSAFTSYQNIKSSLISVQRKTTGNLTTRSLAPLISKRDFVTNSEYLETLLIVVPKPLQKDWLKSYEQLAPMVVPRSSQELAKDEEYVLNSVTLFKKHATEFVAKARAAKFTPRDFAWTEDAVEADEREAQNVEHEERKLFGRTLQLAGTGYADLFVAWTHVKALRVFVESVLRYGLPLEFVSTVIRCPGEKQAKKAKAELDGAYGYLGGNAFGRDKKGKIKNDIGDVAAGVAGLNLGEDYTAYCYFEFDVV
ncbi:hypothetical protein EDC01DRAFT_668396 [Geopyxis carbonaria]|nr:hypothetical protein EDC01DRAFT_668396 [Geopyxis carbonaria]